MSKPYTLKSPCKDCPFRSDVVRSLDPARAQGIMNETYEDSNFYCHKTVDYGEDGEGDIGKRARVCAGHLITMEHEGRANQPTRIAERLGLYDRTQMDMDAPTYNSMEEWVRSYSPDGEREPEAEALDYCGVASPSCSNPAGFARNGDVYSNSTPPECDDYCLECESPVCPECTDHFETVRNGADEEQAPVCVYCA